MRNKDKISDSELLNLLKQEESPFAFEEIYYRYWDKMYNAAYKYIKSGEVAEELVQDLFTDVWVRRKEINIDTLSKYLYKAIRYQVLMYVRREVIKKAYVQSAVPVNADFNNSPEEILIANDLNVRLQTQVKLLPEKCRAVFELSRNEHKSNKEIAYTLGISEKTVENHITKALRHLRTCFNTFFLF